MYKLTGKVYKLTDDDASTRACVAVLFPDTSKGCFTLWDRDGRLSTGTTHISTAAHLHVDFSRQDNLWH